MDDFTEEFTPGTVDERIEQFSYKWHFPWTTVSPGMHLVRDLNKLYAEDDEIVQRAWQQYVKRVAELGYHIADFDLF